MTSFQYFSVGKTLRAYLNPLYLLIPLHFVLFWYRTIITIILLVYRGLTIVRAKDWTNLLFLFRLWGRTSLFYQFLSVTGHNTPGNTSWLLVVNRTPFIHPSTSIQTITLHLLYYNMSMTACCTFYEELSIPM